MTPSVRRWNDRTADDQTTTETLRRQSAALRPKPGKLTIKKPPMIGVGMPAMLHLEQFGSYVWDVFGTPPYLVGSAATGKQWRDVDVRLILSDDEYLGMFGCMIDAGGPNAKWSALCMAFAALGTKMTGLPIDFQIQPQTWANERFDGVRCALGVLEARIAK